MIYEREIELKAELVSLLGVHFGNRFMLGFGYELSLLGSIPGDDFKQKNVVRFRCDFIYFKEIFCSLYFKTFSDGKIYFRCTDTFDWTTFKIEFFSSKLFYQILLKKSLNLK